LHHYYGEGLTDVSTPSVSLATGVWHSYAVTFLTSGLNDGKGTISLYLDGTLRATDSDLTGGLNMPQTLVLGGTTAGLAATSASRDFTGGVDEFAFSNEVLTAADVTSLHNKTATPLSVPEPTSAVLLGLGALSLCGLRRRR
jgi:hypothetical protein